MRQRIQKLFGQGRSAFSLMEVNIAILAVAGGLLVIMGVFPASLRLSVTGLSDTRQATFATDVLGSIQGGAAIISEELATNAFLTTTQKINQWTDAGGMNLRNALLDYLKPNTPSGQVQLLFSESTNPDGTPRAEELKTYFGKDITVYYIIKMRPSLADPLAWQFSVKMADTVDKQNLVHEQPAYTLEIRYRPSFP